MDPKSLARVIYVAVAVIGVLLLYVALRAVFS